MPATRLDGVTLKFEALVRIYSTIEVEYYRHGGMLQMVIHRLMN